MLSRCVLKLPRCVCVCVCVSVLRSLFFYFIVSSPFYAGGMKFPKITVKKGGTIDFLTNQRENQNGGGENTTVLEGVNFFHLNLLTFSYYCTDLAFVV